MLARIEIEQAEVDLDVAVSSLHPAQREDTFASTNEALVVIVEAGELEREIGLDCRADVGRALGVDVEAAILQLPGQNGFDSLIDTRPRRRVPNAVNGRVQPDL